MHIRSVARAGAIAAIAAVVVVASGCQPQRGTTERVSVSESGAQTTLASGGAQVSGDGRYVVFSSSDPGLVADDPVREGGNGDVFVRDRAASTTHLVSRASDGTVGDRASSGGVIGPDGRFVGFTSSATNLVADDTNGVADAYVRDLALGTTSRVLVGLGGTQTDGQTHLTDMSADGRYVLVDHYPSGSDAIRRSNVFLVDRATGTIQTVAHPEGPLADFAPGWTDLSGDGSTVVFDSVAENMDPGGPFETLELFVWSRETGATTRITDASTAEEFGSSVGVPSRSQPSIDFDGSRVVWSFERVGPLRGDGVLDSDLYLWDRSVGVPERLTMPLQRSPAYEGTWNPKISGDGSTVAATAPQPRLDRRPDGTLFINEMEDVMLWEIGAATSRAVSVSSDGVQSNDHVEYGSVSISDDGQVVAYQSDATNLVFDDTNGVYDVFAWEAPR